MTSMFIIEAKFGVLCILIILYYNVVMEDWISDEKPLNKWQ